MAEHNGGSRVAKIGGNDFMDLHAFRTPRFQPGAPVQTVAHPKMAFDDRARTALAFIERWAMIAAESDGEDSAGRQKLRRMTPQEIVDHACACAVEAFAKFEARGWYVAQPSYEALNDTVKEYEDAND